MTSLLCRLALATPLVLAAPVFAAEASAAAPAQAAQPAPPAKGSAAKGSAAKGPAAKLAPAKAAKDAQAPAKPISVAEWKDFTAADSGFSARFPGAPERNEAPAGPMSVVAYAVEREAPAPSFMVMVMSAPAGSGDLPPEMLEQVTDGIAEKLGKNVTRNAPSKAAGHPARDLVATGEEGSVAVRLTVVGGRLYQLMALAKGALPEGDVSTFFESFRTVP